MRWILIRVRVTAAAIGTALTLALAAAGSGASRPQAVSWVDAKHGWRIPAQRDIVQSTENGGRTWRTIFPGYGGNPLAMLRMSRLSGLVTVIFVRGATDTYWTRDNGRHWWLADWRLLARYDGRGRVLYTLDGGVISQIWPWPPRGRPRCRRGFSVQLGAKLCKGEFHNGGMHAIPLMRTPAGQYLYGFKLLSGGFAALYYPTRPWEAEPWTPSVGIRRNGVNRIASLPAPELLPDLQLFSVSLEQPHWPRLVVVGKAGPAWRCDQGEPCASVRWETADGGRTWSVTSRPQPPIG
jgi:hypothetical protein